MPRPAVIGRFHIALCAHMGLEYSILPGTVDVLWGSLRRRSGKLKFVGCPFLEISSFSTEFSVVVQKHVTSVSPRW